MVSPKFIFLILTLLLNYQCLYISKQPLPTLFVNQQFRYNITHNAGSNINFSILSAPPFVTVTKNGQLTFFPQTEGSYQLLIQCINSTTNNNLLTLSYILSVVNKKKQLDKIWIINQQEYFTQLNQNYFTIVTEQFNFDQSIRTNQNIWLRLKTQNSVGTVTWFYQKLPSTISGSKSNGVISGYAENQGTYMVKCTAIDSTFKQAQIFIFLKFVQPQMSLQQNSYSEYNVKNAFIIQERQQNALMVENQLKSLINNKKQCKSKRSQIINNFQSTNLSKQRSKFEQNTLTLKIQSLFEQSKLQSSQMQKFQNDLNNQKIQVDQNNKILKAKQLDYSTKLQKAKNNNVSKQVANKQLKKTRNAFQFSKNEISTLESLIFQQQNDIRDIQYQKSRSNVTYVSLQKQEVRSRQILQIRKNIEFQYLIKKAQTDNKARRNQDYVFLAQTNYDFAYVEYKQQILQYLEYSIKSSYLQSSIQNSLRQYEQINKTLSKLKINYQVALGAVDTLKVAKEQLSRLSAYALNSAVTNISSTTKLTQTQLIEEQAKTQVQQYPFAGCQSKGNYAWAGSGKIRIIGKNSLILGSQETVNFGKCTKIKTQLKQIAQLMLGQWIQFSGYYWNGDIQATSITLIAVK